MNARADLGLLILRISVGCIMFVHGAQKLLGWYGGPGIAGFTGWMASMHVSAVAAWLAMLAEFLGGIALVLGFGARVAAFAIAVEMLVAIRLVHWKTGFFMNWGSTANRGEGWEYSFLVFAAALALALTGPGRIALGVRRGGRGGQSA